MKFVHQISEEQLRAEFPLSCDVPGWYFRVDEVSQGHYIAEGTDRWGRTVSVSGGDSEILLRDCSKRAAEMQQQIEVTRVESTKAEYL